MSNTMIAFIISGCSAFVAAALVFDYVIGKFRRIVFAFRSHS